MNAAENQFASEGSSEGAATGTNTAFVNGGATGDRMPAGRPGPVVSRIRTALFSITATDPEGVPRSVGWIVMALFLILLVWSMVAELDVVAVATGRLVPQSYVKIVQPADAGIVREILVHEGDVVESGQVLVRLDPTENAADTAAIAREIEIQRLQVRRVDAELVGAALRLEPNDDGLLFAQAEAQRAAHRQQLLDSVSQETAARERAERTLAAAIEMQRKLEKALPSYEREAAAFEKLAAEHLVGPLAAEEKRRTVLENSQDLESQRATVASLESAVSEADRHLDQVKSAYAADLHAARVQAVGALTQLEQQRAKVQFHREHLELRAPQAGTVKELGTTTLGSVVQPGTVLLTLVPRDEPLVAEVSIENDDIGFVREGQPVRVKFATYPFQKYGTVEGVVRTVIADSRQQSGGQKGPGGAEPDAQPGSYAFKAIVALRTQELRGSEDSLRLAAGMQLSAEVMERKRTVLEYLLSPIQKVSAEAATER